MNAQIRQVRWFLLIGFVLSALTLLYWQVLRATELLQRDDNPRLVVAEQRIRRGKIFTPAGLALAETVFDENGIARRNYPYPDLSAVTGYYSLRYNAGGLEAAFDERLSGVNAQSTLDQVLHRPPVGAPITVTIDLPAQVAADNALLAANADGAVVVINHQTGDVAVMASRPIFNPNTLDETWDALAADPAAPLVNRVTQGLFPLGEMVRWVGLIGLHEAGTTVPPEPRTAPLDAMLAPLSARGLVATARQLRFDQAIPFSLNNNAGVIPDALTGKTAANDQTLAEQAAEIAVTPLQLAMVGVALANDGAVISPTLVQGGELDAPWGRYFGRDTAAELAGFGPEFSGLASPEVTGNQPVSWYLGIQEPWVIVVAAATPAADRDLAGRIAAETMRQLEGSGSK